jgi:hypothetical protein
MVTAKRQGDDGYNDRRMAEDLPFCTRLAKARRGAATWIAESANSAANATSSATY